MQHLYFSEIDTEKHNMKVGGLSADLAQRRVKVSYTPELSFLTRNQTSRCLTSLETRSAVARSLVDTVKRSFLGITINVPPIIRITNPITPNKFNTIDTSSALIILTKNALLICLTICTY